MRFVIRPLSGLFAVAALAAGLAACRTPTAATDVSGATSTADPDGTYAGSYEVVYRESFEPVNETAAAEIAVCNFNISFVGHWKARDKRSEDIADLLRPCDVVVIEELVAPPLNYGLDDQGRHYEWLDQAKANAAAKKDDPEELIESFDPWWKLTERPEAVVEEWEADYQARHFVGHMVKAGFQYTLSEGDTGKTVRHNNSTASEWSIAFWNPETVEFLPKDKAPGGWTVISDDEPLVAHPVFDRVPWAFSFRARPQGGKTVDFTLVPVHLHATDTRNNESEKKAGIARARELLMIRAWAKKMQKKFDERDIIVLGDMNVVSREQAEDLLSYAGSPNEAAITKLTRSTLSEDEAEALRKEIIKSAQGGENKNYATLNIDCHPTNTSDKDPKPFDHIVFNRKATREIRRSPAHEADMVIVDIIKRYKAEENWGGNSREFVKAYSDHHPMMFTMALGQDDD